MSLPFFICRSDKRYVAILFFAVFMILSLVGKSQSFEVDSLKLNQQEVFTPNEASLYLILSQEFINVNLDSAVYYGEKGLSCALDAKLDEVIIIEHLMSLSKFYIAIGDFNEGKELLERAEKICLDINNPELLVRIKLMLSFDYRNIQNYGESLNLLSQALDIINENNLLSLKYLVYSEMSTLYGLINDVQQAEFFLDKAYDSYDGDMNLLRDPNYLLRKGKVFSLKRNYDSSFLYYNNALNFAKTENNLERVQRAYRKISSLWIDKKRYDMAMLNIDSSILVCKELKYLTRLSSMITYKAHVYSLLGDDSKVLKNNIEAFNIRKYTGNKNMICSSLLNIGGNYLHLNKYDSSLVYLRKGLELAHEVNNKLLLAYGYNWLSKLYKAQSKYKEAFDFAKLSVLYNDSLLSNKTSNSVLFFKRQYELEKEKTLLKEVNRDSKTNLIIFIVIILIVIISSIYYLLRVNLMKVKSDKELRKLSNVVENINHAVVITKNNGEIIYVNDGFVKMTGFTADNTIVGKSWFSITNIYGKEIINKEILSALIHESSWHGEMFCLRHDGTSFVTEEWCSVIKSEDGTPEFFVIIFNDITERKEAELDLRNNREELRKAIQTRDKMLSVIANDLTKPFSAMLGFSKLLATEFSDYQTEDHIRFSKLIYESGKNTFDLLSNLLYWSRYQLGRIELLELKVDIYELISDQLELSIPLINKKGIDFINNVDKNAFATVDHDTISIVFKNLLSYSLKTSSYGSVIRVTSMVVGSMTVVIFSIEGEGFTNINNLFDIEISNPKSESKHKYAGDLGMFLIMEFTKLNDGIIEVDSTAGAVSKFIVKLPRDKQ